MYSKADGKVLITEHVLSDHLPGAGNTPPLLEVAADDNTEGEEEAGREDARGREVVFYVPTTVSTSRTHNKN